MEKDKNIFKKIYKKCFGTPLAKTVTVSAVAGVLVIALLVSVVVIAVKTLGGNATQTLPEIGTFSSENVSESEPTNEDVSTPEESGEDKKEMWQEVPKADMPTLNNATISQSEMESQYRGYTDRKIYEIRTTSSAVIPTGGGTAYYFSNSGSQRNDGLSPEKPKRDLNEISRLDLKEGDVIYFERGCVWRGSLNISTPGITVSAYGEGKKPEFYSYQRNAGNEDMWEETDAKNVWAFKFTTRTDIGSVIVNGGEKIGIKAVIADRENPQKSTNNTTGRKFSSYADLDEDMHFFHDTYRTGTLYLYCDKGNPGKVYDDIEFGIKTNIISVTAPDVTIDNLCIKYGGAHGVGAGSAAVGLTVQNCEFGYIGGSIQAEGIFGRNYGTRYGNGVEIYGSAVNFTVKNNYFYQIYDAAATFQYSGDSHIIMENIDFSDNVMEYCNYSVEYFLTADPTSYMKDITIQNNLMWYAGYGLCEQRPDKHCDSHIKAWAHTNPLTGKFVVSGNLFALAKWDLLQSGSKGKDAPIYDNNTYIQFANGKLGSNGQSSSLTFKDAANNIPTYFGDNNAKIIYISK